MQCISMHDDDALYINDDDAMHIIGNQSMIIVYMIRDNDHGYIDGQMMMHQQI